MDNVKKCSKCDGTGTMPVKDNKGYIFARIKCDACNGTGSIKIRTNFSRVTSSVEALARFVNKVSIRCYRCGRRYGMDRKVICPFEECIDERKLLTWLQEETQ